MQRHHARIRSAARDLLALGLVALASGCAQTDVHVTRRTLSELAEPDRVLVRNFAVTRAEVELDGGIAPELMREVSGEVESAEARKVGHAAAEALADELVKALVEKGIPAEGARARRRSRRRRPSSSGSSGRSTRAIRRCGR